MFRLDATMAQSQHSVQRIASSRAMIATVPMDTPEHAWDCGAEQEWDPLGR
jgi:hypothetical protein